MHDASMISSRLADFLRGQLGIHFAEISAEQWRSLPLAPVYRFGWMPPVNLADDVRDDQLIVMFSPDLLAAVLAQVSDEIANDYLTTVEAIIAHYVEHRTLPTEQIERKLEDLFFQEAPYAVQVRSEVELAALDAEVVPVCH